MDSQQENKKKKEKITSSGISAIFGAFVVFTILVIFLYYNFITELSIGTGAGTLSIVFIFTLVSVIGIKSIVMAGEKPPSMNDVGDISLRSFISVLLIVAPALLASRIVPIVGRSFENTVGYFWIKSFGGLKDVANGVFQSNGMYEDHSIIATQITDDKTQFDTYLADMSSPDSSPFKGVTAAFTTGYTTESPIYKLYELVVKKHSISEATLVSLATIVAMYTCFLPIKYPWIRA
jgi:hypothetical protein